MTKPATNGLYITAAAPRSGKSVVLLGLLEQLLRRVGRVAVFRPFTRGGPEAPDPLVDLLYARFRLDAPRALAAGLPIEEAVRLAASGRESEFQSRILDRYGRLREHADFVLCLGSDRETADTAFDFDVNAETANHLGVPVLGVVDASGRSAGETRTTLLGMLESLREKRCRVFGMVLNRLPPSGAPEEMELPAGPDGERPLLIRIPEEPLLSLPTLADVAEGLGARVLGGAGGLMRHVSGYTVAAMHVEGFLERVVPGSLVITPGDRSDIIVACLASSRARDATSIAGLVLTGGMTPAPPVQRLIEGLDWDVPVLLAGEDTFPTAKRVSGLSFRIRPDDDRKLSRALALFDEAVDGEALCRRLVAARSPVVTPVRFEFEIIRRARRGRVRIVLPEGLDERILRAAEILVRREVADLVLLGPEAEVRARAERLGLELGGTPVIDPAESEWFEDFAATLHELRRHKGVTPETARDLMASPSYFGTMMVWKGLAGGMVSGAAHTTADTIRPAFEFVKTRPGVSVVSSVFFMCLPDRVLVYGDCAVNPDPNAAELADIAVSSAETARSFGIEPVVAMLSYSSGASGRGADVEKVREAVRLARKLAEVRMPGIEIDGPIQYDAAVDPAVASAKMPGSAVAGRATVFVFPDLNTGNNTYKAVQRSAGAVAVGPILQGLKKPVNDLSRGCTVTDIVNTVAITAIQAREAGG